MRQIAIAPMPSGDEAREDGVMDVEKAIFGRRSVRQYADQAIDESVIRSLVQAAAQAPSAVNEQPWTFTVVRDQKSLDHISDAAKSHMLATMGGARHADHFRVHLSDPKFHIFYHAPALILISAKAQGPWIVEDCALAAENLMLAAYAAGLGSCWIGFAQSYLNTPGGKAALGLPAEWIAVAPIILGHPSGAAAPVPRKPPETRWVG
jgi:nitroreductase